MVQIVDCALRLSEHFRIFPIWTALPATHAAGFICACGSLACKSPGKHPVGQLVPRGLLDASQDPKKVKWWWEARPDANIGIATGRGIVVIDVDPRNGGDGSLADLQRRHGQLPLTLSAHTGGGGRHYFFEGADVPSRADALGPGLDVKCCGGYVVAAPSVHVSGRRYRWDSSTRTIARLPENLRAELIGKAKSGSRAVPPESWRELITNGLDHGERNAQITRLTGHLLRRYVDPHVTCELMHAFNVARCRPPLDPEDVTKIVRSICGREMKRRGNG